MSHETTRGRRPAAAALSILLLACLALAACGGSSGKTASSATASASASTTTGTSTNGTTTTGTTGTTTVPGPRGAGAGRFAALRECLAKNGITLPKRKPGQAPGGGVGGFLGGGPKLPAGVSRAKYEAAIKKCGGLPRFPRGGFRGPRIKFNSPAIKAALTKFAACLRSNGVNIPEPNTSGKGPIFSTKGLNTASPTFRAAETKCRSDLQGAFGARRGTGATRTG